MIEKEILNTQTEYDTVIDVDSEDKLFIVSRDSKYGITDEKGNRILDLIYDDCKTWAETENYIAFKKSDKFGLYSIKDREFITDFIYENISYINANKCFIAIYNTNNIDKIKIIKLS